jgi:hypothetical protein
VADPVPEPDPAYARAWRSRPWRLGLWVASWPFLLAAPFAALAVEARGGKWTVAATVLGCVLMNLALCLPLWSLRCPQCGGRYFWAWWWGLGPFAGRCLHCELPFGSPGPVLPRPLSFAHLQAEVRLRTPAEGGWSIGPRALLELQLDGRSWQAAVSFLERPRLRPGETATARILVVTPGFDRRGLHAGSSFELWGDGRPLARGVVAQLPPGGEAAA